MLVNRREPDKAGRIMKPWHRSGYEGKRERSRKYPKSKDTPPSKDNSTRPSRSL